MPCALKTLFPGAHSLSSGSVLQQIRVHHVLVEIHVPYSRPSDEDVSHGREVWIFAFVRARYVV